MGEQKGAAMDWTNSADDAAGVDEQARLRALIEKHPWLSQIAAGATGAFNSFGGPSTPTQARMTSNLRSEAPVTFRSAQYGIPAGVGAFGAVTGNPWLMGAGGYGLTQAAINDPLVQALLK